MKKIRTICCVITARPSYSRVKTVLQAIKDNPHLKLQIILCGSAVLNKYGFMENILKKDGLNPDILISNSIEGPQLINTVKTVSLGMIELSHALENLRPDIVITIADRFETIATAIASAFLQIPLVHIQGGEVTGSIDEKVRHAITKLSDFHFVSNADSFKRVVKMGENSSHVFNTGCPSIDIARQAKLLGPLKEKVMNIGVGFRIDITKPYIIVMQHSVTYEHLDSSSQAKETLDAVINLDIPTFWFWPNIDVGNDEISKVLRISREKNNSEKICFVKNLPPEEFLRLLIGSKCLIGNSSVGIRESSYLGVPVVNIGSRQRKRVRGINVKDVEFSSKQILRAAKAQIKIGKYKSSKIYGNGQSGKKIADLLTKLNLTSEKTISY